MGVVEFLAGQLRRPSGLFGRLVTTRLLNRANAPMNKLTLEALDLRRDDRVLEVGFGGGDLIARMLGILDRGYVVGADFSPDMVAHAARRFARAVDRGSLELHCASVAELPFVSGSFTRACTVNTVYFWPDPPAAFAELRRVLCDEGRLVVGFSPRETMQALSVAKHGFTLYDPVDIVGYLSAAGFEDITTLVGSGRQDGCACVVGRGVARGGEK